MAHPCDAELTLEKSFAYHDEPSRPDVPEEEIGRLIRGGTRYPRDLSTTGNAEAVQHFHAL